MPVTLTYLDLVNIVSALKEDARRYDDVKMTETANEVRETLEKIQELKAAVRAYRETSVEIK